jgi:chromosome segregation ATPase
MPLGAFELFRMSDANTPNNPPSQPNSSANKDWQDNWGNAPADKNVEEQLFYLMELTNSIDRDWQEGSDEILDDKSQEAELFNIEEIIGDWQDDSYDSEGHQIAEEQLLALLDDCAADEPAIDEREAVLADFADDWLGDESYRQADWFAIAHQLEEQNQELSVTLFQLKQALDESQQQLQLQTQRSQAAETTIAQQAHSLQQTQEQLEDLVTRLEASQQEVQRQQLTITTLSHQLESDRQQVAQLEREYTLLQEDCDDKAQKIVAMEKHLRELWTRLHRQQRYALEYKAALEECMGTDGAGAAIAQEFDLEASDVTAIEAWSSRQEDFDSTSKEDAEVMERAFVMEIGKAEVVDASETSDSEVESFAISPRRNWPSPVISSDRQFRDAIVDLPFFLRTRHSR